MRAPFAQHVVREPEGCLRALAALCCGFLHGLAQHELAPQQLHRAGWRHYHGARAEFAISRLRAAPAPVCGCGKKCLLAAVLERRASTLSPAPSKPVRPSWSAVRAMAVLASGTHARGSGPGASGQGLLHWRWGIPEHFPWPRKASGLSRTARNPRVRYAGCSGPVQAVVQALQTLGHDSPDSGDNERAGCGDGQWRCLRNSWAAFTKSLYSGNRRNFSLNFGHFLVKYSPNLPCLPIIYRWTASTPQDPALPAGRWAHLQPRWPRRWLCPHRCTGACSA